MDVCLKKDCPNLPAGYSSIWDIKAQIEGKCVVTQSCVWTWGDSSYKKLSRAAISGYLRTCPVDNLPYVQHCHDCDDFARETKAYHGMYNLAGCYAVATVYAMGYDAGTHNFRYSHAMNLFTCSNGRVYMAEPQYPCTFWEMPGGGCWGNIDWELYMVAH